MTRFATSVLVCLQALLTGCENSTSELTRSQLLALCAVGHSDLLLVLKEITPEGSDSSKNHFVLTLTNRGRNKIVLDGRVLSRPTLYTVIVTQGRTILPTYGIPPTPQDTHDEDYVAIEPGKSLELRFALGKMVYDDLDVRNNLIFCYIDGRASQFSPSGYLEATWQGSAYSNALVFEARGQIREKPTTRKSSRMSISG